MEMGIFAPKGGGWIGYLGQFLPYYSSMSLQKLPLKGEGGEGEPLAPLSLCTSLIKGFVKNFANFSAVLKYS